MLPAYIRKHFDYSLGFCQIRTFYSPAWAGISLSRRPTRWALPLQNFPANEQIAIALVIEVLQNVCPSVTRFSPTCYAELLEYLHDGRRAVYVGYARPGCTTKVRRVREGPQSLRRPFGERVE